MVKHIYANWDPIQQQKGMEAILSGLPPEVHLSVPMSLLSKKSALGSNAVWPAAPGSYTESIGSLLASRMQIPFVLFDFQQWMLHFPEPLQEIRYFSQKLAAQKTGVLIRLKTSLESFFDGTMEGEWIEQVRFILEGLREDAWQYFTFSFAHPYHNYYQSNAFIEKINDSYQTIRGGLTDLLGSEASTICLLTELPLESAQRECLIQENSFDGVYFPNASIFPAIISSKKTK